MQTSCCKIALRVVNVSEHALITITQNYALLKMTNAARFAEVEEDKSLEIINNTIPKITKRLQRDYFCFKK